MSKSNPFSQLLRGLSFEPELDPYEKKQLVNDTLEEIFGFTLNREHSETRDLLYLEDVSDTQHTQTIDMESLNHALFERLVICNSDTLNLGPHLRNYYKSRNVCDHRPVDYLYNAYIKLHKETKLEAEYVLDVKNKIILNAATMIIQPEVYNLSDIDCQMVEILKRGGPHYDTFFVETTRKVLDEENDDEVVLKSFINSINKQITQDILKMSLVNLDYSVFTYFRVFVSNSLLPDLFIESCAPNRIHLGSDYAVTPLGALFNLSVLPKTPAGNYEHFTEPTLQAGNSRTEEFLWASIDKLTENIHWFIISLIKCSTSVKNKTLIWLGDCLKYNADRGKLWNSQAPPELNPATYTTVTDGFMLNMCNTLLRMCQPFTSNWKEKKILKVDPTFCAVPNELAKQKGVHMHDLVNETCLIPVASNDFLQEERFTANSYNFITESFFMAHKAIDLGYRVSADKLIRLNTEIGRMERAYRDAMQQASGNHDLISTLRDRMNGEVTKYLSLKCQLSDPVLMKNMFDLISATCYWLCQVALKNEFDDDEDISYAPLEEKTVTFPLPNKVPDTLKCIPEYLLENVVSFMVYLRRFHPKTFEDEGYEKLEPILTFLLMYMGSSNYLKNPHLRARLAEGLESLLPVHKDDPLGNNFEGYQRKLLFTEHPFRLQIIRQLMDVFVGIEMTGQSVEFEQKFNYRRPMYAVFEYLWEIPSHMDCFTELAVEAEENMEAVHPPLFLRFANLLINDAIFLLDEALSNMAKLREMQSAQNKGEWNKLSANERSQNISYMHHIGNLARFDNILGKDTITMLEKLTSKIHIVFTHPTMVDRIAAMLNYFLLNLVGPNKKNFKVKGQQEYSFDPAGTVMDICKIYVNLKDSAAFCLAVSQDGRSYSPQLFSLAEAVLVRIGGGLLIGELNEVAEKVAEKAREYKANEEAMAEAPEDFLDPIMSTLMSDPVILPSSKQTVDRATIARHLLSDQTDPFNRSPLSMDQVIPNTELAEKIRKWVEERKASYS